MQSHRKRLARSEVLILRPDVLHLYRLHGKGQGRLPRRREKFSDAGSKPAKTRSPGYRQPAIHRSFRSRTGSEKFRKIVTEARSKGRLREGRILALAHFDGAFR